MIRSRVAGLRFVLALSVLVLATHAHAVTLRRIALTGESAPGTPPGVFFLHFGSPPGIGDDFAPTVDGQGNVSFHAVLAGPGITYEGFTAGNGLGVWKHVAGVTSLVAREDEPAPGTEAGVEFMGFLNELGPMPPAIAAGRVVYMGGVRGPGVDLVSFSNASGLWTESGGVTALLLRNGQPAPGRPAGDVFSGMSLPWLAPSGAIATNGTWHTPQDPAGSNPPDQEGFWSTRDGTLQPIVMGGEPAPGTAPGVTFGKGASFSIGGAFRSWDITSAMRLAVHGNLKGAGIDDLNDEGIWHETSAGSLTLLAREGDPAPGAGEGVRFGIVSGIDAFGEIVPVRMSAAGAVMFGARLSGPDLAFMRSIWSNRTGTLAPVVRGTPPVTDADPGDPAPGLGPGYTFSAMNLADIDGANRIAFTGSATLDMQFDQQLEGIWWDRPGALTLVAADGGQPPGTAPGVVYRELNRFLDLSEGGRLVFLARLGGAGVTAGNEFALFGTDDAGGLQLVVRAGQAVEVGGGELRFVAGIVPGLMNASGEIPLDLNFTDGSSGLFVAQVENVLAVEPGPTGGGVKLALSPNPRPAGEALVLRLELPAAATVACALYDIRGRRVAARAPEPAARGRATIEWNPGALAPGVYLVRLDAGALGVTLRRLVVL